MPDDLAPQAGVLALIGFIGGLVLFVRGLIAYRLDQVVSSIATSPIDAVAAGEVRITGTAEPLATTLLSPLQSKPCLWYRASIVEKGQGERELLDEERSVEFMVRDETGEIRIIPRRARFEFQDAFDEATDMFGMEPVGLQRRAGAASTPVLDHDREAAVAALLTVRTAEPAAEAGGRVGSSLFSGFAFLPGLRSGGSGPSDARARRYREARLEPGATVTVIGQALPFGDLKDLPVSLDTLTDRDDMAVRVELEAAQAAGLLAASPEEAWGNAAIPGFGIGRPVSEPELDPEADVPEAAPPGQAEHVERVFEIADEALVVSRAGGTMAVYAGTPDLAARHHDLPFYTGLAGVALSIASAVVLGAVMSGGL